VTGPVSVTVTHGSWVTLSDPFPALVFGAQHILRRKVSNFAVVFPTQHSTWRLDPRAYGARLYSRLWRSTSAPRPHRRLHSPPATSGPASVVWTGI